ncbi:O-acetylhomoserine aminocarboxypropyltransferase/cysteine synthase family protein [Fundidesulfovibrio agrisoli]|uniref:O-acetylhomoserine aminocarboxypropyltransferase/cysteine synthase family protein n=1 Tax=Fundidesulfovibrio agrisoli TaxID=2922717 RepID=UPI001FACBEAF|nr:O-acetylhomoserine aminocarboxypropyltransferase/cysteine synthase family protein [Fundidesulfovibrio agrisoli]
MSTDKPGIETLALHAGQSPDCQTRSRAVPIYQTTSYTFRDTEHAANLFGLKEPGYIYSRIMNPTNEVLENRLAAMHGGSAGLCFASGMAAIFAAVTTITQAGQNFVTGSNLYGGTVTLFAHTLKRFGIEARFVDTSDPAAVARAIDSNTRLVYTESIGNPRCNVDDMEALAAVAHEHGLPLVVDNTVAPPPIFNPFDFGADICVYSLTKIIGGHGNSIGGAIVEKGGFDWAQGGKFPEITEPDPTYHGVNFFKSFCGLEEGALKCMAFTLKARCGMLRDTGACLAPLNAFLILQGVETLPLRARAHCENALAVARFLSAHPAVSFVNYAGLPGHKDHERAARYFPLGPGAVFGFGVKGGLAAGAKFIDSVKLCSHLANILDAKTLVIHPASTTHSQLTPQEQLDAGVSPDLVRISVGLESAKDIIADLDQALAASQA